MEENKNLPDYIEYIIIENDKTNEIIAKITQDTCDVIEPFIMRIKYKKD